MPVVKELNNKLDEFIQNYRLEKMKSGLRGTTWDRIITFETIDEFANSNGSIRAYSETEYFMKAENTIFSMYISMDRQGNKDVGYLLHVTDIRDKFYNIIALELDDNLMLNKNNKEYILNVYNIHCKICSCFHTKSARGYVKATISQDS